jgi:hypothetical protein
VCDAGCIASCHAGVRISAEYVPFSKDQFTTFAHAACAASLEDNPELASAEYVDGLANFLHIVAVIAAKQLSGVLDAAAE